MIKIAIDAMGGDFGPEPILEGVVLALEEKDFLPILVLVIKKRYYHYFHNTT